MASLDARTKELLETVTKELEELKANGKGVDAYRQGTVLYEKQLVLQMHTQTEGMLAVVTDDYKELTPEQINEQNPTGKTALMIAGFLGNVDAIEWMKENGADVDVRDQEGWTYKEFFKQYQERQAYDSLILSQICG